MKTITQLELELSQAKEHNLIEDFEHIQNRDCILVRLKAATTDNTCQRLKTYIRDTYKEVMYVTLTPYDRALYIRYVI
jgi:hypothetical protein